MKKELGVIGLGFITFILMLTVWGCWPTRVIEKISTTLGVMGNSDGRRSTEINEVKLPLEAKAYIPKPTQNQVVKSRPVGHSAERVQENRLMSYQLKKQEDIDPNEVDVVRWPNDHNDSWVDSAGKAFPADMEGYSMKATIRNNPKKDLKYVLKYAGRGAFVGHLNGEIAFEVPYKREIHGKEYHVQDWLWLDNKTLIGVMNLDLDPTDHVEYGDTRIHLFKINDDLKSGGLVEVSTPFIPHRSTIKIEGVTAGGALVLSRVYDGVSSGAKFNHSTEKYSSSGYEPEKFLGVFEVEAKSP